MNYSKIKAEDKYDNTVNLYTVLDYGIDYSTILLYLKSGGVRELMYENTTKAREKYNYFLKLERKNKKEIQAYDSEIY